MNRLIPADFAASTRCSCPVSSTDSIESPACRDRVEDAVEITASTPRQAPANESGSLRSPTHTSTPRLLRSATFSVELVARTSALTFSPRQDSLWQISLPTMPVAPTTRIMSVLPRTQPTPVPSLERGSMRGRRVGDESKSWLSLFLHRTSLETGIALRTLRRRAGPGELTVNPTLREGCLYGAVPSLPCNMNATRGSTAMELWTGLACQWPTRNVRRSAGSETMQRGMGQHCCVGPI